MNTARSLGHAIVLGDTTAWWVYLVGPPAGAVVAAGIGYLLRGSGGGSSGTRAAQGTLGWLWRPGPIGPVEPTKNQTATEQASVGILRRPVTPTSAMAMPDPMTSQEVRARSPAIRPQPVANRR